MNTLRNSLEYILIPLGAILASMVLFGVFVLMTGNDPFEVYYNIYRAAFGSWFSWQKTLIRAAPLMLTALCVALPARLGLVVIGGEGAVVMGGLAAAVTGVWLQGSPPLVAMVMMAVVGMLFGGSWIAISGGLKHWRGVNETISSLLLNYIAIALLNHFVNGPFRDPASLNKPSTHPIGELFMLGNLPGMRVHVGLAFGVIFCLVTWFVMYHTVFGFSVKVSGGNLRTARLSGLSVGRLVLLTCFIGGSAGGLAGMVEVAAVHGNASSSLNSGYGYTGILVAFIARHNPFAVLPIAILLGGIGASGGLLQRIHDLPDATVLVMQGLIFLVILFSETLYGKIPFLKPKAA